MRPSTRLRVLIFCCVLSLSLLGGVGLSAEAPKHRNHHKHHKHHNHHEHLRVSGGALPKLGTLPGPSLFGINTGTYDNSQAKFERDIPTARSLGARWDHFTSGSVHFYGNGQPNWSVLDYEVTHARENGLGVLISLGGAPGACSISSVRSKDPSDHHPRPGRLPVARAR